MKPEQLKWTDTEWASHLQWDVRDIPALRKWLNENYFPSIGKNNSAGGSVFVCTNWILRHLAQPVCCSW